MRKTEQNILDEGKKCAESVGPTSLLSSQNRINGHNLVDGTQRIPASPQFPARIRNNSNLPWRTQGECEPLETESNKHTNAFSQVEW